MKDRWEDCDVETQARLIAFSQLSEHDEFELQAKLAGAKTI
ncbi:MAG: hypothetical protein ACTHK7_08915 [Aureliella sp.]